MKGWSPSDISVYFCVEPLIFITYFLLFPSPSNSYKSFSLKLFPFQLFSTPFEKNLTPMSDCSFKAFLLIPHNQNSNFIWVSDLFLPAFMPKGRTLFFLENINVSIYKYVVAALMWVEVVALMFISLVIYKLKYFLFYSCCRHELLVVLLILSDLYDIQKVYGDSNLEFIYLSYDDLKSSLLFLNKCMC